MTLYNNIDIVITKVDVRGANDKSKIELECGFRRNNIYVIGGRLNKSVTIQIYGPVNFDGAITQLVKRD